MDKLDKNQTIRLNAERAFDRIVKANSYEEQLAELIRVLGNTYGAGFNAGWMKAGGKDRRAV